MTSQLQQLREVGSTESGDGVPSLGNRESLDVASITVALGDVGETLVALFVEPWVEETEYGLAGCQKSIVDKGEDASCERA